MNRLKVAAICVLAVGGAVNAAEKPKSMVGLWEVKSATVNGDDVATSKLSPPYLRKGSTWRFEEDGTGKYGVTETKWTYKPEKLQPLVITEKDVFGKTYEAVKASVQYVGKTEDIRLKYEFLGGTYVVILSPE